MATAEKLLSPGQQFVFRDPATHDCREFTIVRALSRGAFAQSFLANGKEGHAVLKSSVSAEGEDLDLRIEAKVLQDLVHPNVVRYFGTAFDHQWRVVLAFERLFEHPLLVYNKTVDVERLPHHPGGRYYPLPINIALNQFMDLLCGLEYMHEAGFVHTDVKLANFMVYLPGHSRREAVPPLVQLEQLRDGRACGVLIDVGGCWSLEALEAYNQGDAEVSPQLTPIYAPPEAVLDDNQTAAGRGRILHPTMDTYSAALVFYATLTGQTPYAHLGKGAEDLIETKRHERRGTLSPIDPAAIEAVDTEGVHLRMRASELKARVLELLQGCVHPDASKRTTTSKARRQLQEAFEFVEQEDGLLRQSVARDGALRLPPKPKPVDDGSDEKGGTRNTKRGVVRNPPVPPKRSATGRVKPVQRPTQRAPRPDGTRGTEPLAPTRRQPPVRPRPKGTNSTKRVRTPPAARRRPPTAKTGNVFWLRSPVFPKPLALQAGRPYIFGRAGKADLPIPSDRISRRHASLSWEGGALMLSDLGSTNGTMVSGRPLAPNGKPIPLRNGVRFSLGGFEIEVFVLRAGQDPLPRTFDGDGPTRPISLAPKRP